MFCLLAWQLSAGTYLQLRTPAGNMDVELFDQEKPGTVKNFLRYLESGRYQNIFFHHCEPGIKVHAGPYFVTNRMETNFFVVGKGFSYPRYPSLSNELSLSPVLSNSFATLAMHHPPGQPDGATSEWFINLAHNPSFDTPNGGFTVFGQIRKGTNVLGFFNALQPNLGIINLLQHSADPTFAEPFQQLPVLYVGPFSPRVLDLVYISFSFIELDVRLTADGKTVLGWTSVANASNILQYTSRFPAQWTTLAATNGTGRYQEVIDPTTDAQRFYRIRVDLH